jgi:hypothetical protein
MNFGGMLFCSSAAATFSHCAKLAERTLRGQLLKVHARLRRRLAVTLEAVLLEERLRVGRGPGGLLSRADRADGARIADHTERGGAGEQHERRLPGAGKPREFPVTKDSDGVSEPHCTTPRSEGLRGFQLGRPDARWFLPAPSQP